MSQISRTKLPIDPHLDAIAAELSTKRSVVIQAAPGSGKTTRVAPALLKTPFTQGREILVIEPRRLAAKLAAYRVADELGEAVGATIGYHFRFERVGGPRTRIRFLTEGMFVRQLLSDPSLTRVAAVLVDEFHERHLQGDVALGLLRNLQKTTRPDLRIAVMSATLDAVSVSRYLDDCRIFDIPGRLFEVTTSYLPLPDLTLEARVARGVRDVVDEGREGDVLVFLPGIAEIRRAADAVSKLSLAEDLLVVPLYADLAKDEQDRALRAADRRKIILATNVAETSLTIEGVRIVIDGGFARMASHSWWSGLPSLRTLPIAKASAIQRAGRAGRTAPGHCVRLYTRDSFESRPAFETPEIRKADLSQTVLELLALGVRRPDEFDWFEAPKPEGLEAAKTLLYRLGAVEKDLSLTELGRAMAKLPAHPRLARLALEGQRLGFAQEAATLAALLGEEDIDTTDVVEATLGVLSGRRGRLGWAAERARSQLAQALERARTEVSRGAPAAQHVGKNGLEQALARSVLAAYSDRVAKKRILKSNLSRNRSGQLAELVLSQGAGGGAATLDVSRLHSEAEYFVAIELEERKALHQKTSELLIRTVCPVQPDWLFDVKPEGVTEKAELKWNADREKVEQVAQLTYDGLVLDETIEEAEAGGATSAVLQKQALAKGVEAFCDAETLKDVLARAQFFISQNKQIQERLLSLDERLTDVLKNLCEGRTSFAELREADVLSAIKTMLSAELGGDTERLLPEYVSLRGGRRCKVHYETGKPPWIESRLQDFFGMAMGPTIMNGRVPVVLHLLAPNQRAVQVTSDLAGFWKKIYPDLRKELGRRYPKHSWPEDPLTAAAPQPGRIR